jgi:hypothetical protein
VVVKTRSFEEVQYSILSKNLMKGEITLKLSYNEPQKISALTDSDILQIIIKEEFELKNADWHAILKL